MLYLLAVIIPFLSFFLQSYPRFFNKYFGVDVWTRLIEINHVKKAHHKIPEKITKGFIISGYFDYPIIFPWVFSFFSKKTLLKIQGFVAPFFDSLQNYLLFFITYYLTYDIKIGLIAQLIYSLTPMIPIENSYMTPRSLGYLNFTLAFLPLLYYHINQQFLYLLIGFIFTTTLFLAHRFALQAFLFIIIFFTFVDRSLIYLLVFALALTTVIIITKGYYFRIARGHLANIYFWILNYQYRFTHQIYKNKKRKKIDWVNKIYELLSLFPPIFLLAIDVWALSGFLYLYFFYSGFIPKNALFFKMGLWVVFFYVFGVFVLKIKRLIPIGEGQRYIEMATVPSSILSAVLFSHFYSKVGTSAILFLSFLLLGNLVVIIFVQIKGVITDKNRTLTEDLKKVFFFMNKLPGTPRIMCIPHQMTTMTVYNTKADVLVNADNSGLMKITDFFPVLKKNITQLKKQYNLDYLLLRESFIKRSDIELKNAKVIFSKGEIKLIKL